jgi:uncharacterized protein YxjI
MAPSAADYQVLQALTGSDRFLVQQLFRMIGNDYQISIPQPDSTEPGPPLVHVHQKRMKIREDIRFRSHPDAVDHLFMIKSQTVFEFAGRHAVLDAEGAVLGYLEKSFGKSLIRSHWRVLDGTGTLVCEATEASLFMALARRFGGMISDWLAVFELFPFHFDITVNGEPAGRYGRVTGKLRDRYVLDLGVPLARADRRLMLAFAVALDALQDR